VTDAEDRPDGFSTRAVHAGGPPRVPDGPIVNPIVPAATFFTAPVPAGEVRYTRYGTNPNHEALAARLRALEGADAALAVASGNAAMSLALLACTGRYGRHVVAQNVLYGGTLRILRREFPELGIGTTLVDPYDARAWRDAVRPDTGALLMEVPVNPLLRVPDPRPVAALAQERGIPVIVDATFATPYNFRPLAYGAALVVHSATKYLGGHSDVTAGVVAGRADLVGEVHEKLKSYGPVLDPYAAWLLERGIKTLAVRMQRHNANALAIAAWLEAHPSVERVLYPGLPSHPDHALAGRLLDGFGGMVSAVIRGGDEAALRVLGRLRRISVAPSLGGVETLVSMPRFTSHTLLTREERHAVGIADGFVRFSIGIEDTADLVADLAAALDAGTA
jgi:cystathionine beta-lyase/cystathionine gamma-synthase